MALTQSRLIGGALDWLRPFDKLDFGILEPLARQGISVTWMYNSVIAACRTPTTTCSYFFQNNNFNNLASHAAEKMAKVQVNITGTFLNKAYSFWRD